MDMLVLCLECFECMAGNLGELANTCQRCGSNRLEVCRYSAEVQEELKSLVEEKVQDLDAPAVYLKLLSEAGILEPVVEHLNREEITGMLRRQCEAAGIDDEEIEKAVEEAINAAEETGVEFRLAIAEKIGKLEGLLMEQVEKLERRGMECCCPRPHSYTYAEDIGEIAKIYILCGGFIE